MINARKVSCGILPISSLKEDQVGGDCGAFHLHLLVESASRGVRGIGRKHQAGVGHRLDLQPVDLLVLVESLISVSAAQAGVRNLPTSGFSNAERAL